MGSYALLLVGFRFILLGALSGLTLGQGQDENDLTAVLNPIQKGMGKGHQDRLLLWPHFEPWKGMKQLWQKKGFRNRITFQLTG